MCFDLTASNPYHSQQPIIEAIPNPMPENKLYSARSHAQTKLALPSTNDERNIIGKGVLFWYFLALKLLLFFNPIPIQCAETTMATKTAETRTKFTTSPLSNLEIIANKYFEIDGIEAESEQSLATMLLKYIGEDKRLNQLLNNAEIKMPVRTIGGYSATVTSLYGENYALLGNAGEFLDPVFSSGVTIAMHSASLVAPLVSKQLNDEQVDWEAEFTQPLYTGIETFRHFVTSWYDTSLQKVIFFGEENNNVKQMICSILAGYAWDKDNPYVSNTKRRLKVLSEICQSDKTESS